MSPLTTEEKLKVIDKIKKLMALGDKSRNNQIHEAETALAMAQKLMQEYQLHMSDVQIDSNTGELKDGVGVVTDRTDSIIMMPWESRLAGVVDILCSVDSYFSVMKFQNYKRTSVVFVGLEADVLLAKELYQTLRNTISTFARRAGYPRSNYSGHNAYTLGMVSRLLARAKEMVEAAKRDESQVRALVVVKDRAIKAYMNNLNLAYSRSRVSANGLDANAFYAGKTDAESVRLGPNRKRLSTV